jgi:excisionase family DNA binding protein
MSDTAESPATPLPLAVDPKTACQMIGVGITRLYELIKDKEIAAYLEGSRRRIPTSALREYVERQTAKGAQIGEAKGRKPPKRKAQP